MEDKLKDLKPGDGVKIDDQTTYEFGADLEAEGTPLIDPAVGKTMSIRLFEYRIDPSKIKQFPTSRQTIFNSHAKQIAAILCGDGLRPIEHISPRVIIKKKEGKYQIFVPCEARLNTMFIERPKSLSEALIKNATPRH